MLTLWLIHGKRLNLFFLEWVLWLERKGGGKDKAQGMVSPWYCLWFSNKLVFFFMNTEVGFYTAWSSTSKSTYHRPHFNAADALAVTLMSSRLDSSWIKSPLFNVRVIQCQISSWIQLSKLHFWTKCVHTGNNSYWLCHVACGASSLPFRQ